MPGDLESSDNLVQLVSRIAARDEAALTEFYDVTSKLVYGLVKKILNSPSVAEEVTLDVYMQVWRQAERYSVLRGSPKTWLIMLARSRAIDSLRSRRIESLEHPIYGTAQFVDEGPSAEDIFTVSERQSIVQSALKTLCPCRQEAIALAFHSGLTHTAIAQKLRVPLGTIKSRIRSGMMQLREQLSNSYSEFGEKQARPSRPRVSLNSFAQEPPDF